MSGVAPKATLPDQWTTTQNVKWAAPIAGQGWSSPIVWGDTIYVTTAIGAGEFKKPSTGLFGNDYIAELQAQGITGEELMKRIQARDNEMPGEVAELRQVRRGERRQPHVPRDALARRQTPGNVAQQVALRQRGDARLGPPAGPGDSLTVCLCRQRPPSP